jgi:hypothetical protein
MTASFLGMLFNVFFGVTMVTAIAITFMPRDPIDERLRRLSLPRAWGRRTASQPASVRPAHSQPAESIVREARRPRALA